MTASWPGSSNTRSARRQIEFQLRVATRAGLGDPPAIDVLIGATVELKRMLSRLIVALRHPR